MPYVPPALRARLAAEAVANGADQGGKADATPGNNSRISICVRQPKGPLKNVEVNEQGSLGFGARTAKVPHSQDVQAARQAQLSRAQAWAHSASQSAEASASPDQVAGTDADPFRTSATTLTVEAIEKVFDCPAQGTLTFLRDVLSDGETPSPWSWSGYERIPTDVSVDKYLDQWRENELRRRERARKRAERNGTPDSTAELRSVDIASEELRPRLVQAKNIAEDGFAKQKACLLGRVLVFDRNAHPLFDPYATTKSCSNKTVDCVSSARRNKKALSTLTIENQTLNERMLTEAITELEIQDAEARPSGPASEVNKKHIFKPLQKDPAAQAMNGELWCHSNIGQLLPPSLKEEWISFCSRYEARNCRLFDAFAKSSSAAGQSIENCEDDVQDSEPASLFGTTFYFNGLQRDKDGARLVNFNRPVPLYALSRHRNSNDNTRADRVRTRNRPGEGPVEFLGWFRLTSLRLVAPHSPELIRMLEIKDGAKGFKKQRSKEAWAKSLSTAWARIGIERIRTKTFTIGHDETAREVLLMDPSMASGCPDELEAYISKLAGLQTS